MGLSAEQSVTYRQKQEWLGLPKLLQGSGEPSTSGVMRLHTALLPLGLQPPKTMVQASA